MSLADLYLTIQKSITSSDWNLPVQFTPTARLEGGSFALYLHSDTEVTPPMFWWEIQYGKSLDDA